ncbi:MAG: amidohydrolase [Deltaproteobacteria bacterium]|nr:amidohydrolase [Deltaproteobacteria bacterium]
MQRMHCDLIFYNGKIVTVDNAFSIAEAVAIGGGTILKVGGNSEVRAVAESDTREIDLKGKMMVPGFVDTHPHVITWGIRKVTYSSIDGLSSIEDIKTRIADEVKNKAPGEWVVTTPIGDSPYYLGVPGTLKEKRWPNRWDLDEASPDNPVFITAPSSQDPCTAVMNSYGLKLMAVDKNTPPEQQGVEILKDPDSGEPNGQFHGMHPIYQYSPFYWKLAEMLPQPTYEEMVNGVRESIKERNAAGMTATYEAHSTIPRDLRIMRDIWAAGDLTMRCYFGYDIDPNMSLSEIETWMKNMAHATGRGFGDDWLKIGGVTVSIDGPTQYGKSLMNRPYLGPYGDPAEGVQIWPTDKLKQIAVLAARNNLRLNSCVAGDKAIDITLEVFEAANEVVPIKEKRWVLQHIQFPSFENIRKCKELGIMITTCSNFEWGKGEEIYVNRLGGGEYCDRAVPFRDWLDGGVVATQTTDYGPYQPMFTIWQSLKRIDGLTGKSLMTPHKKITREEAIRLYSNGARILFWEDKLGSIEAGKLADLVVLDNDILNCPLDEIKDTNVLLTMVGGKAVSDPMGWF